MATKSSDADAKDIIASVKAGNIKPIYLLHGEEPYYIDVVADYLENNIVAEENRDFDFSVLYGGDVKMQDVLAAVSSYPMMSDYRLVVVREAQQIREKDYDLLQMYAKKYNPKAVLVLCCKHKKLDARKGYFKEIQKIGVVMESNKIYDNQVPTFIVNYVRERQKDIKDQAAQMLSTLVGPNLKLLATECDKLILSFKGDESTITEEMVQKIVGMNRAFDTYELLNAVVAKDIQKANTIALVVAGDKVELPAIVPAFFSFFQNLMVFYKYCRNMDDNSAATKMGVRPFFVRQYRDATTKYNGFQVLKIISILREYDMKSKGVDIMPGTTNSQLLQEMIYKIMHCNGRNDAF
ncbi:MAG: DNA polymerase III subunit delta [Bacteroidales bacterium]|nr:DNA polymerase III subunit delta [Candidatus Scybalocola fimicaballi]